MFLCLALGSINVNANNLLMIENKYNNKLTECSDLKSEENIIVHNQYLASLSHDQKAAVLISLYIKRLNECSMNEENAYVLSIVNLAIQENNSEPINEFIRVKRFGIQDKYTTDIINTLDQSKLKEIEALPQFSKPFSAINVVIK